ncbi:MAG TPA: hypothetical protein ACHBX6_01230 [Arsenophonus nasoniae]|uniref:hypothetical protein n=1 Tax=Arsenophonus nasoniae TaxID=638 RepID=UPI003879B850
MSHVAALYLKVTYPTVINDADKMFNVLNVLSSLLFNSRISLYSPLGKFCQQFDLAR